MRNRVLALTGGLGAAVAALCCVTPLLPWVLAGVGLSGLTQFMYRDSVLIPIMIGFLVLMGVALWRMKNRH